MITGNAFRAAAPDPLADPDICDPLTGIVPQCCEIVLEPDDPSIFAFFSEATNTVRFGGGQPPCNRFGCAVGLTREWALQASIGESVERYSAAIYDPATVRYTTFDELAAEGVEAVDPHDVALFSAGQYREFAARTSGHTYYPFTRSTRTGWVEGYSLTSKRAVQVPAALVYLPYKYAKGEPYFVDSISTGLACARSRDEAVLKALYEAVERDAVTIPWLNSIALPRIRIDGDDELGELYRARFKRKGLTYIMLDSTLDIPIPTFVGLIIDERGGTIISSATRLDPFDAARKTLLEAAQGKIAWKRETISGPPQRFADDFHDVINFPDHSKVYMLREMRQHIEFFWKNEREIAVGSIPSLATGDSSADLAHCIELLRAAGLETIALDVTSEDVRDLGLWVARVVIPGLQALNARHDAPQLGGTRLYDVPVKCGLASRAKREDELNVFLHPFP